METDTISKVVHDLKHVSFISIFSNLKTYTLPLGYAGAMVAAKYVDLFKGREEIDFNFVGLASLGLLALNVGLETVRHLNHFSNVQRNYPTISECYRDDLIDLERRVNPKREEYSSLRSILGTTEEQEATIQAYNNLSNEERDQLFSNLKDWLQGLENLLVTGTPFGATLF